MIVAASVPSYVWFAANAAIASIAISSVGLLVARGLRRYPPRWVHGALLAVCSFLLVVPIGHLLSDTLGISWWKFDSELFSTSPMDSAATSSSDPSTVSFASNAFVLVFKAALFMWLARLVFLSLSTLRELVRLRRWLTMTGKCDDAELLSLVDRAACLVGVPAPEVHITSARICPMIIGISNVRLIVPTAFVNAHSSPGTLAILVHECEHIRRNDNQWNILGLVCSVFYWWNPLVAQLIETMDRLREQACDDRAVEKTGEVRSYASALLRLARQSQDQRFAILGQSLIPRLHDLVVRVERLADNNPPDSTNRYVFTLAAMTMLIVLMCVPLGMPSVPSPASIAQMGAGGSTPTIESGVAYVSLDAQHSSAVETLSSAIREHDKSGTRGLIVDFRDSNLFQRKSPIKTSVSPDNLRNVIQANVAETQVSVVVIAPNKKSLPREIRELIASSDREIHLIGGWQARRDKAVEGDFVNSDFQTADPFLSWAIRILRHV